MTARARHVLEHALENAQRHTSGHGRRFNGSEQEPAHLCVVGLGCIFEVAKELRCTLLSRVAVVRRGEARVEILIHNFIQFWQRQC